jgi:hypothetical protein
MGELHEKHDVQHEVQHQVQRGIWVPTQQLIKTTLHHQSNTNIYSQKTLHVSITLSTIRLNTDLKKSNSAFTLRLSKTTENLD